MTEKIIPISLQAVPNSDSVLAVVHQINQKIEVLQLSKEDVASLREDIIAYYQRIGHLTPEYQPNVVHGIKPKKKPVPKGKTIAVPANLYMQFQQLYNQNKKLKAELSEARQENLYLKKIIRQNKKDID